MQDLFIAQNKQAQKIEQVVGLEAEKPKLDSSGRSMNPTRVGRIYGKFTPSPLKTVKVRDRFGGIHDLPMTRKERRVLARGLRNAK